MKSRFIYEVNKSVVWLIEIYVNIPVLCRSGTFTDAVYPLPVLGLSEYLLIVNI
jgi:hypothetical protein